MASKLRSEAKIDALGTVSQKIAEAILAISSSGRHGEILEMRLVEGLQAALGVAIPEPEKSQEAEAKPAKNQDEAAAPSKTPANGDTDSA